MAKYRTIADGPSPRYRPPEGYFTLSVIAKRYDINIDMVHGMLRLGWLRIIYYDNYAVTTDAWMRKAIELRRYNDEAEKLRRTELRRQGKDARIKRQHVLGRRREAPAATPASPDGALP